MTIRSLFRIVRRIAQLQGPRVALRVAWRHLLITLRRDGLVRVPTPREYEHGTTLGGEKITAVESFRHRGTGPLITLYKR